MSIIKTEQEQKTLIFTQFTNGNRALAERATRTDMNSLPYWQQYPFAELQGEQATDKEFKAVMQKLA